MNLTSIGMTILYVLVTWGSVTGSYYVSRWAVTEARLKDDKKATLFEKIYSYGAALVSCFIIAGFFSEYSKHGSTDINMNKLIATFIVLSSASLWGVFTAFSNDNELSNEQKVMKKKMKQYEDKESERNFDGRF